MKSKFIWTGDLTDDCSCKWRDLLLRAECMSEGDWWWAVVEVNRSKEIESSNDDCYTVESGVRARELAEICAIAYYKED